MDYLFLMSGFLLSLLLGMMIVPKILLISYKKRLFDMPDSRKVHEIPVPRLGGISFFPVILIVLCFILGVRFYCGYPIENLPTNVFLFFAVGGMMLFLIGVADDLVGVGYRYKFLVQILAAFLIVWPGEWFNTLGGLFGIYELPKILGVLFTLFVVVYITNAINLIDGIDGLASGLSSVALLVFTFLFISKGLWSYAMLSAGTFGVLVPFFYYNVFGSVERARKIFMGDTGSMFLGYVIAAVSVMGSMKTAAAAVLIVPLVALAVPITDTVLAIVRRRQSGVPIFSPDKNHLHHRLLAAGLSQKQVVLVMYALTAFFSAAALLVVRLNPFLGVAVILLALGVFIFWAKKLGVMREVVLPASEKDEK